MLQIYYHLEEYGEAVRLALGSGPYFDIENDRSQYTETMLSRCIDEYASSRGSSSSEGGGAAVDPRLEAVAERMFRRCLSDHAWSQALGLALESRRLDWVSATLVAGGESGGPVSDAPDVLSYAFDVVSGLTGSGGLGGSVVGSRAFRREVMQLLAERYAARGEDATARGDTVAYARVLHALGDAHGLGGVLTELLTSATSGSGDENALLTSLQIGFDVAEGEDQAFALALLEALPKPEQEQQAGAGGEQQAAAADSGAGAASSSSALSLSAAASRLRSIITGSTSSALWLDWASKATKTDQLLLKTLKNGLDARSSVLHHALLTSHGFMACGTSGDTFLRTNLDYLGKAANWAKFSVTASQGVIHRGQPPERARELLASYLPSDSAPAGQSPFSEGGALYACGLIAANRGAAASGVAAAAEGGAGAGAGAGAAAGGASDLITYLSNMLRNSQQETLQHGASLGLGLAALGSRTDAHYAQLRDLLFQDSAVAGEAAGIATGLLLAGSGPGWKSDITGDAAATELLAYAHETQHEKTIRGIAMGLALQCAGVEEGADGLIRQMTSDKDPVLRYGGMWATGLAYAGTGNNGAVKSLLHAAVSDVSDDVRRAAVTVLGLVLLRSQGEVPALVAPLAESYNPHVRYGAALAVGIACAGAAGTDPGLEALRLLETLVSDSTDYVRQGALLAIGLVLQGQGEGHLPKGGELRAKMQKVAVDKHVPSMTRMGAILGLGLADMGGRNMIVSPLSRAGLLRLPAVIGIALWAQYWYWFPLLHCISLAAAPAGVAFLRSDLTLPESAGGMVTCACPPSWFAYPPPLKEEKEGGPTKVTTVELSVTAKAKARQVAKEKEKAKQQAAAGAGAGTGAGSAAMAVEAEGGKKEEATAAEASAAAGIAAGAASLAMAVQLATAGTPVSEEEEKAAQEVLRRAAEMNNKDKAAEGGDAKAKKADQEPESYALSGNPTRVTPAQAKFLTLTSAASSSAGSRYAPLEPRRLTSSAVSVAADGKVRSNATIRGVHRSLCNTYCFSWFYYLALPCILFHYPFRCSSRCCPLAPRPPACPLLASSCWWTRKPARLTPPPGPLRHPQGRCRRTRKGQRRSRPSPSRGRLGSTCEPGVDSMAAEAVTVSRVSSVLLERLSARGTPSLPGVRDPIGPTCSGAFEISGSC